jgi:Calx-beta domain/Carboxypeptidase regulatory-like domain/Beta-propeller repeat
MSYTRFVRNQSARLVLALVIAALVSGLVLLGGLPNRASSAALNKGREISANKAEPGVNRISDRLPVADANPATSRRAIEAYGKLPLSFEVNTGQTDARVKFLSRGAGYNLFLTSTEAVLSLERSRGARDTHGRGGNDSQAKTDVLRMKLVGANPAPKLEGSDELPGKSNYFIGNDPKSWRVNVSNFGRVHYRGIYPGVDVVYYGNQRQLENDFVVAPGVDPKVINLTFDGAKKISTDAAGNLVLETAGGKVQLQKPVAYQEVDGSRHEIGVRYDVLDPARLIGNRQSAIANQLVGFEVAAYDLTKPLVIDPVLVYSTYLGGNGVDVNDAIAVDGSGNAYLSGSTSSTNFPGATPPLHGQDDVFVVKFNATGSALIYSTYLGGSGSESGFDIAIDSGGDAYVTGKTTSANFPLLNAFKSSYSGGTDEDAFVSRLDNTGAALVYSTYLAGNFGARGWGIAASSSQGFAYVTGTTSTGFPVTASAFESTNFNSGFLVKLNTNGAGASSLVYSTFLAHTGFAEGRAIAADVDGSVYITGNLNSTTTNFATPGAFQTTFGGGSADAFVEKFNPNLSGAASQVYATYLGGSAKDIGSSEGGGNPGKAIAIDESRNAYITGATSSTNFPLANASQGVNGGQNDAFLTKLNATGSSLIYSTYLGGTGDDFGRSVAVNVGGGAYVTGVAGPNFPTVNSLPTPLAGVGFVAKFTPSGTALVYSTILSGVNSGSFGIAVDLAGNAFATGNSNGSTIVTTASAFQANGGGGTDGWVTVIADPTIIGRVSDENGNPLSGAVVNLTGVPTATTTTDANGGYTFGLLTVGNSYTVSVSAVNYLFNSQAANNLQKNVRLDFSPVVVSIGGQVTLGAGGLSGTTMTLSGGKSLSTATDGGGNYSFANLPAGRNYTVTPAKASFGFEPTSRSFTNTLVNQTANFIASATIQFNVGSYTATETAGKATITITRTSGASGPASVRYGISDGTALQKSDYILAFGTLNLAAGETSKSFDVLIVDDAYVEGDEFFFVTLSDAVGATLGTPNPAMVTITDNDTVPTTANPIDQTRFFVQQQYYDFLSRYPDQAGWDFWINNIDNCAPQPSCIESQRINTSAAFFLSIEFQQTGYLVEKMYKASYGDASGTSTIGGTHQLPVPIVRFTEFLADAEEIGQGLIVGQPGWETVLENNKQAFASEFVQRSRFTTALPTTLTPAQFVDALNQKAGNVLSASERTTAINLFGGAGNTSNPAARAQALRQVAEDQDFSNAEFNHAFVLMQYFGYLRRSPNDAPDSDYSGYDFWLTKLNQFNGNYLNAEMVKAFLSSDEYRKRFAP